MAVVTRHLPLNQRHLSFTTLTLIGQVPNFAVGFNREVEVRVDSIRVERGGGGRVPTGSNALLNCHVALSTVRTVGLGEVDRQTDLLRPTLLLFTPSAAVLASRLLFASRWHVDLVIGAVVWS